MIARVRRWLALAACAALATLVAPRDVAAEGRAPTRQGLAPAASGTAVPDAWLPPGAPSPDPGPSPAVFPPQRIPLRFSHARHAREFGVSCVECHPLARTSRSADDRLLPSPSTCDRCHGTRHADTGPVAPGPGPSGACAFCHVGALPDGTGVARVVLPAPNLRFDHAAHAARSIGCGQCHGEVAAVGLATRDQLPRMQGCLGCHQGPAAARGDAKSACDTCHLAATDGKLRTQFATGTLTPPRWLHDAAHGPDFLERHKGAAAADGAFCATCHTEDSCTDCHDGRVRPRSLHPNDFLAMHPVAARQDQPRCSSCHQEQTFCLSCHQRLGVAPSGAGAAAHAFHPPGWSDLRARGRGHHAWEAQRNLSACVGCHTERDCAACHAASGRSGLGIDPHPAGFGARCATMLSKNPRPCLVCHEPSAPELARCR